MNEATGLEEINWDELHQRLDSAKMRLEHGLQPSREERQAILEERAEKLSREIVAEGEADEGANYVEFLLAHERYAIEASFVREVYPLKELAPIPCVPPFILGVINLRGQIISVVDLKVFFNLPPRGITDLNRLLVLSSGVMEFGVLGDVILGVKPIAEKSLQTALTGMATRDGYVRGVTPDGLIVLDTAKILSDKRMIIQEDVQ